jgi:ABC-type polar amino acid transport system ATPase subunit
LLILAFTSCRFSVYNNQICSTGAGKSTLLRTINKLEPIDDGEIIVDGMYLSDPKTNLTVLRAEIGMVFQHFNLYPHKTALKNITLAPRKVRGLSKKQAIEHANMVLDKLLTQAGIIG